MVQTTDAATSEQPKKQRRTWKEKLHLYFVFGTIAAVIMGGVKVARILYEKYDIWQDRKQAKKAVKPLVDPNVLKKNKKNLKKHPGKAEAVNLIKFEKAVWSPVYNVIIPPKLMFDDV